MEWNMTPKKDQVIKLPFGSFPRWTDCPWCHKKLACKFGQFTYETPCNQCKKTAKYRASNEKKPISGISAVYKAKEIAGVWTVKGRNIFTNPKGDIIKDEAYRPIKAGDPHWRDH
jgi:hypothetical protein